MVDQPKTAEQLELAVLTAELDAESEELEAMLFELTDATELEEIERQLETLPHLQEDRTLTRTIKSRFKEGRQAKMAAEVIGTLPVDGEAMHAIISGRFALWDFIPAIRTIARCKIDVLHIGTLGFSRSNIEKLCSMVDAGQIGRTRLLCSHYFKGTSKGIYEFAVQELATRPTMEFLSLRTHAKVALIALADGRKLALESSANLRSCKNIEQVTIFGGEPAYEFHRTWIDELFAAKGTP